MVALGADGPIPTGRFTVATHDLPPSQLGSSCGSEYAEKMPVSVGVVIDRGTVVAAHAV